MRRGHDCIKGWRKGPFRQNYLGHELCGYIDFASRDVVLIDTDPRQRKLLGAKPGGSRYSPRVACAQRIGKGLPVEVKDRANRYEDIIIVQAGVIHGLQSAVVIASRTYIPIQPSQFDIWTLIRMDKLIETAKGFNSNLKAWVIICRSSANPSVFESDDTMKIMGYFLNLGGYKYSQACCLSGKAAKDGMVVCELKPKAPKAEKKWQHCIKR